MRQCIKLGQADLETSNLKLKADVKIIAIGPITSLPFCFQSFHQLTKSSDKSKTSHDVMGDSIIGLRGSSI